MTKQLPLEQAIKVKFDHTSENFEITDLEGNKVEAFGDISSIILHDIVADKGVITGTYKKPKHLIYYDEHVDKKEYKSYIDWCIFCKDAHKLLKEYIAQEGEDENLASKVHKTLRIASGGKFINGYDENVITNKNAFVILRKPFNSEYAEVVLDLF